MPKRPSLNPTEVISRADAHAAGRKKFFTGEPCTRGHCAPRYVSNSGCMECMGQFRTTGVMGTALTCHHIPIHIIGPVDPTMQADLRKYLQACANSYMEHKGRQSYGPAPV